MTKGKKELAGRETSESVKESQGIDSEATAAVTPFRQRLVAEAEAQGLEMVKPGDVVAAETEEAAKREQATREMFKPGELDTPPTTVINGHMMATYVKPHYDTDEDTLIVGMEFSIPLRDEHRTLIPRNVKRAWEYLDESKETLVKTKAENTRPQTVYVKLDPKDGDEKPNVLLHLKGARLRNGIISVVESKGSGKISRDTRYSFQIIGEVGSTVCYFADNYYTKKVWLYMADTEPETEDLNFKKS